jgi:hypothetical protein
MPVTSVTELCRKFCHWDRPELYFSKVTARRKIADHLHATQERFSLFIQHQSGLR